MSLTQKQREYWQRNRRMTVFLLVIWFVVTFVVSFYARELAGVTIFGFPFGFYMGAQGALIIYAVIIWYYAHYMNALDRKFGAREGDD
jgi:putative solute:sodium symporter small subunit